MSLDDQLKVLLKSYFGPSEKPFVGDRNFQYDLHRIASALERIAKVLENLDTQPPNRQAHD